jgi:hypothetical protein
MSATTAKLSLFVASSGPDLRLIVRLDDTVIYDAHPVAESAVVECEFDDSEEHDHVLTFEMQGKLPEHTKITEAGEILEDRCVTITDIALDDIPLGHMITEVATYHHDTNGTTAPVTDSFYGTMGCNGRVEMRFTTPVYLWLLENM